MIKVPEWIEWTVFSASFLAILAIFALSALSALRNNFQFFPPPSKEAWQHVTFLALFRLFLYPLIVLTSLVVPPINNFSESPQLLLGSTLMIAGFGLAFRITLQMGWRNAFGEKLGLITTGWFRLTRNPIYLATWLGLFGWTIVANDTRTSVLLGAWALMYFLAPAFEEPWLEKEYGQEYLAYKRKVRRFL